jgi:hypothetical protein
MADAIAAPTGVMPQHLLARPSLAGMVGDPPSTLATAAMEAKF